MLCGRADRKQVEASNRVRIKTLRIKLHKAKAPPWLYQLILSLFSVRVKGAVEEYLTTALHDKLGALSAEVQTHLHQDQRQCPTSGKMRARSGPCMRTVAHAW